jgi:CDP-paratose 2-epimerase
VNRSHVLITGGCGFVGSSLALAIRRRNPEVAVTALDNLRRRGSELNLPRLASAGVRFLHADVRCREDLDAVTPAPDLIIECSAEPSAQAGYLQSPEYLINTNTGGCLQCLELARRVNADFLFLSTSRVYPYELLNRLCFREEESRFALEDRQPFPGASERGIGESFPLEGPRSLYGMSKLAAELMVEEYGDAYGLRWIINRCGVITGPWQMGKIDQGVIVHWMAAHYFRRPLSYIGFNGSGKQVRDFLHIDDICDLVIAQASDFDRFAGSIFNAGGGLERSLSLRECTSLCRDLTGNSVEVSANPVDRRADVRIFLTDSGRLMSRCDWRPLRNAETTLCDIFQWLRTNERELRPVLEQA